MHLHNAILVDDEVFTRKGLRKLIDWEACGFRIREEADNGADALHLIENLQPELVITDIRMPELDGLELIRQVVTHSGVSPAFIIISGYDDFKYAQQAVRYGVHDFLLKPIDEAEFTETLRGLSAKIERQRLKQVKEAGAESQTLLESLIMGEAAEDSIGAWEKQLGIVSTDQLSYVFIEQNDVHLWGEGQQDAKTASVRFKDQVKQAMHLMLEGAAIPFHLHEHRSRIGVIVTPPMLTHYGGEIRGWAQCLKQRLESTAAGRVFMYAGCPVQGLAAIRTSFESATEALQYKYIHDDTGMVIQSGSKTAPLAFIGLSPGLQRQLLCQIEEGARELLQDTVSELFRQFRENRIAPEAVKAAIGQCVLDVVTIVQNMQGDPEKIAELAPLLGWQDLNLSLRELARLFAAFVEASSRYIAELRQEQQGGCIQKVKAYIDQHYHENMNLKTIAAQFYMNPVYLGQLFKKTYGKYFNDYLLSLRMDEARRLLRQSDMRIYEIAGRVGFVNPDYFVTQFEKTEGVTPTEYRNRLRQGGKPPGRKK
ncbi:DNA-binding response regulator [Paenibacillus sp. CAA11]|uniref:response regulator transcription factor n=1 Tax=Paenibacillus sp. CAA11 TaxID=1532905 RepID=UPI000D3BBA0D|nr:response regulator [Paenibacillus sp. CAA11]AWB46210.1 DNA-binding response regulator [Paenibacillus sp. CAA11]